MLPFIVGTMKEPSTFVGDRNILIRLANLEFFIFTVLIVIDVFAKNENTLCFQLTMTAYSLVPKQKHMIIMYVFVFLDVVNIVMYKKIICILRGNECLLVDN